MPGFRTAPSWWFFSCAILVSPILRNQKITRSDGLQWHNVQSELHANRSVVEMGWREGTTDIRTITYIHYISARTHEYIGTTRRLHKIIFFLYVKKKTPWSESASELYRSSDRRLSTKWLPTFADRRCHAVSVTDPYDSILGFLDRSRYFSIK
jgi:hypothetical protein